MSKKKILLIEDDDLLCKQIRRLLERNNFEVIIAQHMNAAREIFQEPEHEFDLIIVDVMLPENDCSLKLIGKLEDEINDLRQKDVLDKINALTLEMMNNLNTRGGIDLINELRNQTVGPKNMLKIPIIYLTARGAINLIKEGGSMVQTGKVEWLEKPVRSGNIIIQKIEALLQN